jgi:outer membrane protein OmpA-like peptidoglycan-associated protein
LTAKSAALSQPLSVSPTIPLHTTAAEGTKTPASFDSAPRLASSTAIESCTAAIPNDRTAKLETNSALKTADKEVPTERKSVSDLAPEQEEKVRVTQSFVTDPPAMPGPSPTARKHSESRILSTKALLFAAFAGILALMLVEKFPSHPGAVKAGVPVQSAVVQDGQPVGSSVPARSPAPLIVGPSSTGKNTATDLDHPRAHSLESQEVVVRTFSTDLNVTSKNSDNRQELRRIFFNEDSDAIDLQYRPWLQQLADALAKDQTAIVTLEGHTDSLGREAYNLGLSSRRAIAVRNALVNELHVPKPRLTATGAGSEAPVQPNSSAAGRAYNRRVEVRLSHSND